MGELKKKKKLPRMLRTLSYKFVIASDIQQWSQKETNGLEIAWDYKINCNKNDNYWYKLKNKITFNFQCLIWKKKLFLQFSIHRSLAGIREVEFSFEKSLRSSLYTEMFVN